jgi:putative glutamine amidotransferase
MKPRIGITCSTMDAKEGKGVARLHVPEPYVRCVEAAGGLPILLPVADPSTAEDYLSLVDGLLLIGGDDVDPSLYGAAEHPDLGPVDRSRDRFEIALIKAATRDRLPTLGICRGVQVMNVALGGTLFQHVPGEIPAALEHGGGYADVHDVAVVAGCRLAAAVGAARLTVNSHHHQAIDRAAPGLVVTARSSDGVAEAAEAPGHPFLVGVQWHPERMGGADSTRRLFAAFVEAARSAKKQ